MGDRMPFPRLDHFLFNRLSHTVCVHVLQGLQPEDESLDVYFCQEGSLAKLRKEWPLFTLKNLVSDNNSLESLAHVP